MTWLQNGSTPTILSHRYPAASTGHLLCTRISPECGVLGLSLVANSTNQLITSMFSPSESSWDFPEISGKFFFGTAYDKAISELEIQLSPFHKQDKDQADMKSSRNIAKK